MSDLREFLAARYAEDERTARALMMAARLLDGKPNFLGCGGLAADRFWERFTEWRMVADTEAKKAVLELHRPDQYTPRWCQSCRTEEPGWNEGYPEDYPCPTLRRLAVPYAPHPDYRAEWAPLEAS